MEYFEKKEKDQELHSIKLKEKYIISCNGEISFQLAEKKELFKMKLVKEDAILFHFAKWVDLGVEELLLFRQLIYDSVEISDIFEKKKSIIFVKSLILFLDNFSHFDPIFSFKKKVLIKDYFELMREEETKKIYGNDEDKLLKEQLFASEKYLELCINEENYDWFDLQEKDFQDIETEVEKVVDVLKSLLPKLKNKSDKDKCSLLIRDARAWLLLRYDIDKAVDIQLDKTSFVARMFKVVPEIIALLSFLSLLFIKVDFWDYLRMPTLNFLNVKITNIALLFGYVTVIYLAFILIRKIKPGENQFQILLPRLIAGIVVGYFALMTDEAWNGIFTRYVSFTIHSDKFSWFIFWGKILIPLFFVYIYLVIEMSNVKGINHIRSKALRILLRGLSYSILIGIIFSDFFGENIMNRLAEDIGDPIYYFKGIFGNIYPEAILLLSPLALFIGVFLQLLWEDKAVTEKI